MPVRSNWIYQVLFLTYLRRTSLPPISFNSSKTQVFAWLNSSGKWSILTDVQLYLPVSILGTNVICSSSILSSNKSEVISLVPPRSAIFEKPFWFNISSVSPHVSLITSWSSNDFNIRGEILLGLKSHFSVLDDVLEVVIPSDWESVRNYTTS